MGLSDGKARKALAKVALDSIPSPRREVLIEVLQTGQQRPTSEIATALDLPTRTTERALEELAAHRLLRRRKDGEYDTAPNVWVARETTLAMWEAASPAMSHNPLSSSSDSMYDDKAGEAHA